MQTSTEITEPYEAQTTPLSSVANKKRVHYPHANGEQASKATLDDIEQGKTAATKVSTGDHVITLDSKKSCPMSQTFRQRLNKFFAPWREFIEYQSSWSWVILVASFLTYLIGEALTSIFPILFVALQDEYPDQSSSSIALVQSMMNAVPCLAGPIASITTTRLGYRKTAMLGGIITSTSLFASSFARRLQILYFTMGTCYAFGNALVLVSTVVAVTEHFEAKPSFASGVTISGGAFGQCVFAIVLQKLINKYEWNGAILLFSGVVLSIVALGALFREVEWDEEDYEDEDEEGGGAEDEVTTGLSEETEQDKLNEPLTTSALPSSEQTEIPLESAHSTSHVNESEKKTTHPSSNTPPPTHKPSITDDMVFYDQYTKQELLDQYSRSEICLPLALREQLEDEYRQRRLEQEERSFPEQKLSSSTTQIEQTDEIIRAAEVPPIGERSNSCKDLTLNETVPLTTEKSTPLTKPSATAAAAATNQRKARSHHRRPRRMSTTGPHDSNKQSIFYYPLHHQHHNIPVVNPNNPRSHHHHHHHYHPRGNLSYLALCSKNIYNYESVLNICKLQSLHFSIDRSLSLPNLYSPIGPGRKRHRSVTIQGKIETYLEDEEEEEDETKKPIFQQIYRDICELVRVLRILPFLLLCISVTIITVFYDATWTFIVDYMKDKGLTDKHGSHLVSAVGIVAIFGEIGYGYMGDSKRISPLYLYACSLSLAGLSQLLIPLAIKKYSLLVVLMIFISFLQCAQEVLMPILCIKFAGTQNFANAYGMLLLSQGISSLVGPPILGIVTDKNSHEVTYYVIGIGTSLGASLLFTMPLIQKLYGLLTANSKKRKTNTLVTASNGDIPAPSSN